MPTTVHIPDRLLTALDQRAEELGLSRNRLIVRAVEQSLRRETEWPEKFIRRLKDVGTEEKAVKYVLDTNTISALMRGDAN